MTADIAMHFATGPTFLLCCIVIGMLLRLRPSHWGAFGLGVALHGRKPRRARDMCVWRRAAGRPLPPSASHGQSDGVRRALPLLLLAAWLGVCSANDLAHVPPTRSYRLDGTQPGSNRELSLIRRQAEPPKMVDLSSNAAPTQSGRSSTSMPTSGTICPVLPSVCDGTYNGTELCVCSPPPPPACPPSLPAPLPTASILASKRAAQRSTTPHLAQFCATLAGTLATAISRTARGAGSCPR